MSGFEILLPLAWEALKLISSMVFPDLGTLFGIGEDSAMLEWSRDIVLKARKKSHHGSGGSIPSLLEALHDHRDESRSEFREVRRDLASIRESLEECRAENKEFFEKFTTRLDAVQQGVEVLRSVPLLEAEMCMKNFEASEGELRFLEEAHSKASTAFFQGHNVDVQMSAAVIAVAAGYVQMSKAHSPGKAKRFTINATLSTIVKTFAPTWADPSLAATTEGKTTLAFLLNLVACVCVLPPENEDVLPKLDNRLLPAFGALCIAEPELRRVYPSLAGVVVRSVLERENISDLCRLADEVGVNIDSCTSKDGIIQALADSGKDLSSSSRSSGKMLAPDEAGETPQPLRGEHPPLVPAAASPSPMENRAAVEEVPETSQALSLRDATTNRAALMSFYDATGGPSWKTKKRWGTSAPLGDWHHVTVDGRGRVVKLDLSGVFSGNNLTGFMPAALGELTALKQLWLFSNKLSGAVPPELGGLTALTDLNLSFNRLSGAIPPELGGATSLTCLVLSINQLSGSIPPELGGLTALKRLALASNLLSGSFPPELGELTALTTLKLANNRLSGSKADIMLILPKCSVSFYGQT